MRLTRRKEHTMGEPRRVSVCVALCQINVPLKGCQMAKFDPFLSLDSFDCAGWRVEGNDQILLRSIAIVLLALRAKRKQSKNLAIAIWQPCPLSLRPLYYRRRNLARLRWEFRPADVSRYFTILVSFLEPWWWWWNTIDFTWNQIWAAEKWLSPIKDSIRVKNCV